jgi:hypothetical protein
MAERNRSDENPYASPREPNSATAIGSRNSIARIGFSLSLAGVLGLMTVGTFGPLVSHIGMYITFLCIPGLAISIVGLVWQPRRFAICGVVLGVLGSAYLPTIFMSLFLRPIP